LKLSTPEKSEVDKRVAQELKNNQDFIYQTNQALQNLSEGLTAMAAMHQREMAGYKSMHKSLEISFERLADNINAQVKKCFGSFSEMERMIEVFRASMIEDVKQLDKRIPDKEKIDEILGEIVMKQFDLDQSHQELVCHLEASKNLIKGQISHEISSVRNDLAKDESLPDRIDERTRELLKPFYVDFQGLVLEIARLRKQVDYNEKKFEQIYTLIDRLQKAAK
jgi:hypothetical protein